MGRSTYPFKHAVAAADVLGMACGPHDGDQRRQRGATLVGYALTLAMMVAVAIGSITALERNGQTFLENTGDKIGEPRPTQSDALLYGP